VPLRHDQLIPVNKVVNKKEQLEKGLEVEGKISTFGHANKSRHLPCG
jgi:hypothetical protein